MTTMLASTGARRWLGRVRRSLSSRRFVLVYHRIAQPDHDPWRIAVSPARFEEQLQVLRAQGAITSRARMLRDLDAGRLPSRAVAVTFDDGYADTLHAAKPLLDRYDVPATVHLCPGLLDGRTPFWWDALARIVLEPKTLPPSLDLRLADARVAWKCEAEHAALPPTGQGAAPRPDEGPSPRAHPARKELYTMLCARLRRSSPEGQHRALAELAVWSGATEWRQDADRPLDHTEAARLAEGGTIEIGAHTLTHASLPACDGPRKKSEIERGKAACEEIAGGRVESFSYPYNDYDAEAATLVRAAGFTSAWTTSAATLTRAADRLRLPRVPVQDWDGAEFERRLATGDFA